MHPRQMIPAFRANAERVAAAAAPKPKRRRAAKRPAVKRAQKTAPRPIKPAGR